MPDTAPMPPKTIPRTPDGLRQLVRAEMARRGITPYALARDAGVPDPVVYRWLSSARSISVENLVKLLRELDLWVYPDGGER
jgi:plasmid maintenance system antidote protein VapI